jgi:hypothetical protein
MPAIRHWPLFILSLSSPFIYLQIEVDWADVMAPLYVELDTNIALKKTFQVGESK